MRREWVPHDPWPLHASPSAAVTTFPVEGVAGAGEWGTPVVSAHDDVRGLASAALGVRVAPFAGTDGPFDVPVGGLMAEDSLAALARWLGVPADPALAFLLVAVSREAGSRSHEVLSRPRRRGFERDAHLTEAGRRSERKLRAGPRPRGRKTKRLTAASAEAYVQHFAEFGTHFVSTVMLGDVLLQAFAFERDVLAALREGFGWPQDEPLVTGDRALACAALTRSHERVAVGPLISRAGDDALAASAASGEWHDEAVGADSLLAPFTDGRWQSLRGSLTRVEPVAFELTPLNRFLEFYRGVNWQRLLCGALSQRFGDRVSLPVAGEAPPRAEDPLLRQGPRRGVAPGRRVAMHAERLDARDLAAAAQGSESCVIVGHRLDLGAGEHVRVRGERLSLAVGQVASAAASTAEAPRLTVDDAAFDDFALLADRVAGVVVVRDASASRTRTVIDGFVIADAGDRAVAVEAVTHDPSRADADALAPLLPLSARTAERLLCCGAEHEALSVLGWLWRLSGAGGQELARRALALRWAAGGYPGRAAARSVSDRDTYLRVVLRAAADAEDAAAAAAGAPPLADVLRAHEAATQAHEAFWHDASAGADRVGQAEATLQGAERALSGAVTGVAVLAQTALAAARQPGRPVRERLSAEPQEVEGADGRAAVPAVAEFGERLRATTSALERAEEQGPQALPDDWDLAPPTTAEWELFAGDVRALVGTERAGAFVAAARAAKAHLDARADRIALRLGRERPSVQSDGGPALLLAELRLLRAQALLVSQGEARSAGGLAS